MITKYRPEYWKKGGETVITHFKEKDQAEKFYNSIMVNPRSDDGKDWIGKRMKQVTTF